jgi:group II intron reverse transcriptase/maturase
MRRAETVLEVIQDRGRRGLPLEDVYRQLFNPDLYLRAYAKLYSNEGAMTKGTTPETVDDMSLGKIKAIIDVIRRESYVWTPTRRVYIEKKNSTKKRPLGIPTWSDKLVQEVIRLLLEAYYEPQFSPASHGFRPNRGTHTALITVQRAWTGTKWFIEGDIKGCFDNIDHEVLMAILAEKIHDNRFLRLIGNLLKAGYLEEWRYNETLSGTPQGGVISPILSNIYLDRLDKYVTDTLTPEHTRGKYRQHSRPYEAIRQRIYHRREHGRHEEAAELEKQLHTMPSNEPTDPTYRRLRYVRYADDFLLGYIGTKAEAQEIKAKLATFLQAELRLTMSPEKTLITHATEEAARFLGYEISVYHSDAKRKPDGKGDAKDYRNANGRVALRLPLDVLWARRKIYRKNGEAAHMPERKADSDYDIVYRYGLEYRGVVNYYRLAVNRSWLHKLHWDMETSLLKTLAGKHKSTVQKMADKYKTTTDTPYGPMKCLEVVVERDGKKPLVARMGGIPLRHERGGQITDWDPLMYKTTTTELLQRLLADECELCGSREDVRVHHIRKLADLKQPGRRPKTTWQITMAKRRRKTLVVCHECHVAIHSGRPTRQKDSTTGEPCDVKTSSTVRRGVDGNVPE